MRLVGLPVAGRPTPALRAYAPGRLREATHDLPPGHCDRPVAGRHRTLPGLQPRAQHPHPRPVRRQLGSEPEHVGQQLAVPVVPGRGTRGDGRGAGRVLPQGLGAHRGRARDLAAGPPDHRTGPAPRLAARGGDDPRRARRPGAGAPVPHGTGQAGAGRAVPHPQRPGAAGRRAAARPPVRPGDNLDRPAGTGRAALRSRPGLRRQRVPGHRRLRWRVGARWRCGWRRSWGISASG